MRDTHPLAGKIAYTISAGRDWEANAAFEVEDYWENIPGMLGLVSPVLMVDMVYGKINSIGYALHADEIRELKHAISELRAVSPLKVIPIVGAAMALSLAIAAVLRGLGYI